MTCRPSAIMVAAMLAVTSAVPARAADPFDQVNGLVDWFVKLNASWQAVVAEQERAQLLRSTDRLRRSLYALETDSRLLLYSIGDAPPDTVEAARLAEAVTSLRTSLAGVRSASAALGADLRLYGGAGAEQQTVRAGAVRGLALDTLDRQLDDPTHWDAALVRRRLENGVTEVSKAQLVVTDFRRKLTEQH